MKISSSVKERVSLLVEAGAKHLHCVNSQVRRAKLTDPQKPTRYQQLRVACMSTAGDWIRAVTLALQHHTDEQLPIDDEVRVIFRRALILLVGEHFNQEAVLLLDSSSMQLPKSLEDSDVHDISAYLRGTNKDAPEADLKLSR